MTGASRGIGRAVARELARRGAHVIALARTQGALEELDDEIRAGGDSATLVPCDIADFDALDRLGATIFERWGKLDILVGNAGLLGALSPIGHFDPPTWDKVFAVNVTANFRLIRAMDPLLRQSDAGRAVFISSGAAQRADLRPYWGLYAATKAALDALARTYAAETVNTSNVRVMLVNPGPLRTQNARLRDAGRRSDDAEDARRSRAEDRRPLHAGIDPNGEALRFPAGQGFVVPRAGIAHGPRGLRRSRTTRGVHSPSG